MRVLFCVTEQSNDQGGGAGGGGISMEETPGCLGMFSEFLN